MAWDWSGPSKDRCPHVSMDAENNVALRQEGVVCGDGLH